MIDYIFFSSCIPSNPIATYIISTQNLIFFKIRHCYMEYWENLIRYNGVNELPFWKVRCYRCILYESAHINTATLNM